MSEPEAEAKRRDEEDNYMIAIGCDRRRAAFIVALQRGETTGDMVVEDRDPTPRPESPQPDLRIP